MIERGVGNKITGFAERRNPFAYCAKKGVTTAAMPGNTRFPYGT
jgi:hypothetical protein